MTALALDPLYQFRHDFAERAHPSAPAHPESDAALPRGAGRSRSYVRGNSHAPHDTSEVNHMFSDPNPRSLRGESRNIFRAVTTAEVIDLTARALREEFGDRKSAAKEIARAADACPRAAENWLTEQNAPDTAKFLTLARRVPALRAAVLKLLELEVDCDPEAERLLLQMMRVVERRIGIGRKGP